MIETNDGAVFAHMGVTDMVFPILNALEYPQKRENPFGHLDLAKTGTLSFKEYDPVRFPALSLCYDAGREGGTMPAVLNAANEVAVRGFLDRRVSFRDIVRIVSRTMESQINVHTPSLEDIFEADRRARENAESIIRGL